MKFEYKLSDFLDALLYVIPNCVPEDELKTHTTFEWYAEPSGTEWTFKRDNPHGLHMTETRIDKLCSIGEFVAAVVKELDLLIKTHGIVGFRDCWHKHDFPLSSFLKLKYFYMTSKSFSETEYEEKGCELVKTDIGNDIELLFEIV